MEGNATLGERLAAPNLEPEPRPHRSRRPAPWMLYALVMFPVLAAYRLLPEGLTFSLVYNAIALSCLLAILIGIRINKPAETLPWYLLAAGIALWLAGDCTWAFYEFGLHIAPFPSI